MEWRLRPPGRRIGESGGGARDALLGEIPYRGFNGRPVLFLLGAEPQTGLHRGDTGIDKCGLVVGAELLVVMMMVVAMFCVDRSRTSDCNRRNAGKNDLVHGTLL